MKNSRRLWKRWCVVFAGQFFSICVCIYMILVIGKFVCEHMNRIWYSEDLTYILLKWIDDNQGAILLFIMLVSAVLLTIYRFYGISRMVQEIYQAVDSIYEGKNENVSLAMEVGQLENRLNELNMKYRADKQAAKEANQRKNKGYVNRGMTRDGAHVDYGSLQGRHDGTTYNCHYQKGCAKRGVLAVYVLQGYAIDGGEHK